MAFLHGIQYHLLKLRDGMKHCIRTYMHACIICMYVCMYIQITQEVIMLIGIILWYVNVLIFDIFECNGCNMLFMIWMLKFQIKSLTI